jgi:hypothetical protein
LKVSLQQARPKSHPALNPTDFVPRGEHSEKRKTAGPPQPEKT